MTPQEDARVLLALVDRHLRALRLNLDPTYPDEEWGFTAQQAVEELLKARIVLRDERPPFTHVLNVLAELSGGIWILCCWGCSPMPWRHAMKRGRFHCRPLVWGSWRRLRGYVMMLFGGLGGIEMSARMDWCQEELEGLNAQAREIQATIAANVAEILEA